MCRFATMKIKSICIVGGGTSGFMSAAFLGTLNKKNHYGWDIKCVHSPEIGAIGVGESSIQGIRDAHKFIGLKDKDWMEEANATYKIGIRFQDFLEKGKSWSYPFGGSDRRKDIRSWPYLRKKFPETFTTDNCHIWLSGESILMDENKISNFDGYIDNVTSFHFDAFLYQKSLARIAKEKGVEIIEDRLNKTSFKEDGSVDSILCEKNEYKADLFVDCTGFNSLLLEKAMGAKFISYNKTLLNHKAYKTFIPWTEEQKKKIPNYTNCVALKNGWCWEIPLWDGMSYGYVHSNKFADPLTIEDEFHDHVGEANRKTINFLNGRHDFGWIKNVVGIGLSYGFVEPLESNGIASTINNLFRLVEALEVREGYFSQISKDIFNNETAKSLDGFKGWIQNHYSLSKRTDSEYWKHITQSDIYLSDKKFLETYKGGHDFQNQYLETMGDIQGFAVDHRKDGLIYMSYGMEFSSFYAGSIDGTRGEQPFKMIRPDADEFFKNELIQLKTISEREPTHYEYLMEKIYGEES